MMPSFGSDDDVGFLVVVVLVFDVADDLLDEIFDRHDAVRAAVLIDDERHVNARRLHADQQVDGGHRGRHVKNLAADFHRRNRPAEIEVLKIEALRGRRLGCAVGIRDPQRLAGCFRHQPAEQVLDVDHAARIVERFPEERYARYACFVECLQQLRNRLVFIERNNVGARYHQRRNTARAEAQKPLEHLTFGFGEARRRVGPQCPFEGIADILRHGETKPGAKNMQPAVRTTFVGRGGRGLVVCVVSHHGSRARSLNCTGFQRAGVGICDTQFGKYINFKGFHAFGVSGRGVIIA